MNPTTTTARRSFLKTTAAAASTLILPSGLLRGQTTSKLKVGFIGMGGQIQGHVAKILQLGHNVGALCDVDAAQIESSKKRRGEGVADAAMYSDYRVLLEKERSLDAIVIATPDHWHAPICRAVMQAGKHVYCEKPLTHTIAEARELREMSRTAKVITQTGNQGSASPNLRRSMELIAAGFFGAISDIHVWHPTHSWPSGEERPAGGDPIPATLDWDFWLGTAPERGYKAGIYHPAKWRGWYDFGNGSLGDFCCHGFNMPVRALNLDYPTRIEITGTGLGKESFASACTVHFHFAARDGRGPVRLHFYTGGDLPPADVTAPLIGTFGSLPRTGCLLIGDQGQLQSGLWNSDCYIKLNIDAKFTGADNHPAAKKIPITLPRVKGHIDEWIDAIQGGPKVFADFDLGGHLTEIGLSGIVALRLQKNIDWDGPNLKVPGMPDADKFIRKAERAKYGRA
ncbi:Gfo/Idh/MocA family protein [Prosthecobacter sp.]|uniref:Gfo/Idh/MocA family protein n=1 Tax=Prosthecobacter sp. TaxID=1965333 RepID=UPI003783E94E